MKPSKLLIAAVLCTVATLTGCSGDSCTENRSSLPLAGFYSSTTGQAVALDSLDITGIGAPGDSLLLACGTRATEVYLPLRANTPQVAFEIKYLYRHLAQFDVADRLEIDYETIPWFESEACGAMYRYRITSLTHTALLLDSVAIIPTDSVINNIAAQNMRLYFRTDAE